MIESDWIAEKKRIDSEREKLWKLLLNDTVISGEQASELVKKYFPYPPPPDGTILLSNGYRYRKNKGKIEYLSPSDEVWREITFTSDDIRQLASLLDG